MSRRSFLRCGVGAASLAALGSLGLLGSLGTLGSLGGCTAPATEPPQSFGANSAALTAKRWGIVINVPQLHKNATVAALARACHRGHNVPSIDNPKHEVAWIGQQHFEQCFEDIDSAYLPHNLRTMNTPVLCNHCENPPCVRVCPTEATFKRDDGIVNMDYHRCIGCRFCMTACPYNARSLNFVDPQPYLDEVNPAYPTREKGVVEKCTLCVERLDQGLLPYCVEASEGALVCGDLDDPSSTVRQLLERSFSVRRLTHLGTDPNVFYVLEEGSPHA